MTLEMPKKNGNGRRWMIAWFAFLTAVAVLSAGILFSSPADINRVRAGSTESALMNGGLVLDDNGFFVAAEHDGIYRYLRKDGSGRTCIYQGPATMLQACQNRYYFETPDHALRGVNLDGGGLTTELEYAAYPQIVGNWVYYIDAGGTLQKKRLEEPNSRSLGISAKGPICVYYSRIYYIGNDQKLYHCGLDGSDNRLLMDQTMDAFMINQTHLFYLSGGKAYSAATNDLGRPKELVTASAFAVEQNWILYKADDGLFLTDLDGTYQTEKIADSGTPVAAFSDAFCYQTEDGRWVIRGFAEENSVEYGEN